MADASGYSLAIVCEAPADRDTVCSLTDRVLCSKIPWLEDVLTYTRAWRGAEVHETHMEWHHVPERARARGLRVMGRFDGTGGHVARQALLLLHAAERVPDAVVLVLDSDNDEQRAPGLEQARRAQPWQFPIAIGVAHSKRECWVLAGFEPNNETERSSLERIREEIGFDPRDQAERLTAKHDHDKLSAKRVLRVLTLGHRAREEACWTEANLARMAERGAGTGLGSFLQDVEERLVPVITGRIVP